MNKLKIVAVFVTIIALTVVSATAKKPGGNKPEDPKSAIEYALFGDSDLGGQDIVGAGEVGTNVWTYSPELIDLLLSDAVVADTEIHSGSHLGIARCLKKNGPEGDRLDFFFDCTAPVFAACSYRLIVRGGIYDRKSDIVVFDHTNMILDEINKEPPKLKEDDNINFAIEFWDECPE